MQVDKKLAYELGLSKDEYRIVLDRLGRTPTFTEIGVVSVMWSEHCSYKSSKKILKTFPKKSNRLLADPGAENAGVLRLDDKYAIVFKVESHNHPSAISPFQGAATGVGGILRDIFAMGARPVAIMDSLRFGNPEKGRVRYIFDGVISGISHYGNAIGVPTIGGETVFDSCYNGNPLVNVMALGIVESEKLLSAKADIVGGKVIYVGAATGRDGIHGATFASADLGEDSEESRPSVQIGNPFLEKLLLEATLEIAEMDLAKAVQDMGAAGLTSSSTEMAHSGGVGMHIDLSKVPLRESDMTPYEMLLSESQERMLIVARPGMERDIEKILDKWELHYSEIGKTIEGDHFICDFEGKRVVDMPLSLIVGKDVPEYEMPVIMPSEQETGGRPIVTDFAEVARKVIGDPTVASKRLVYRQYDYQVGTSTIATPGQDSAVIRVGDNEVAMSIDGNGSYTYLDPYEGGKIAVAEGIRNLVAMGAKPIGITDCMNFGNPNKPEVFWTFKEAARGISEVCRAFEIPVTGGNVSFYNESPGKTVYPTPVVGIVGIIEGRIPSFFASCGDIIRVIGDIDRERWGGTILQKVVDSDYPKGKPPILDIDKSRNHSDFIIENRSLFSSVRDISDGGALAAIVESISEHGAFIEIGEEYDLYNETQSRYLISYNPLHEETIVNQLHINNIDSFKVGRVIKEKAIKINGRESSELISIYFNALAESLGKGEAE